MIKGLYTSALGMTTQMQRMDVLTNNLANVNTTGYKRDIAVTQSFTEELMNRLDDPGQTKKHTIPVGRVSLGVFVDDVYTDFSNGSFKQTNGSLDVALSGEGFFCVTAANDNGEAVEMYTRDGSFTLGSDGNLLTMDGSKVVGESGNIVLPNGVITIDSSGFIYVNEEPVDRIKLVDFEDKHTLRKYKDNLYTTTEDSVQSQFRGTVEQGYLESSNVSTVREMVDMITVSRAYEANSRLISIHDTTLGRAVNDIARR